MLPRWLRLGLWLRCLAGSNPEREGLVSWLAPRVESKCRLSLRPDGYTLFFFPTNRVFESQADFDNALHGRVALCKTAQPAKTRDITKAPKNRIGLVTFATSMAYLRSNGTHRFDDKWKALLEREKYAERHGYAHYVWLGNLDGPATAWCSEKTASNALGHAVKTLALLAVLETGDVDAVLYADVDSTPTRPQFNVEQYLALSDEADLFMSSQAGKPILMNGGLFILRNSEWSRDFLAGWWGRRCGMHDQFSLWQTLFSAWSVQAPSLNAVQKDIFANYSEARRRALPALVETRAATWPALRGRKWPCAVGSACGDELAHSHCVSEPMLLPHVLVLPVVSFLDASARLLPPLQSVGALGLFCHRHCAAGWDGRNFDEGCVGRLKPAGKQPKQSKQQRARIR